MKRRRLFVAGSSGAVGRTVVRLAAASDLAVVPHLRPRPDRPAGPGIFELSDGAALASALDGCTTVVQLIGTMRKRFAAGDTYETSDIGTTRQLVEGARTAGGIDHLVLLSSVGAARPRGAYLRAKAEAEALVTLSGIPWTIFRPSFFDGEGHKAPPLVGGLLRALGMTRYQPITVEQIAGAILACASDRAPLEVALEGKALWDLVGALDGPGHRTHT